MSPPPRSFRHVGETAELVRATLIAGIPAMFMAWIYVAASGGAAVLGPVRATAVMIGAPVAAVLVVIGLSRFTGGLFGRQWSGGDKPAPRVFSIEEAAVAQGRTADAERLYRGAIFEEPQSREARLRLAGLLVDLRRNLDEAELLYQEVRQLDPTPADEVAVFNGLLDLYRMTGRSTDFDAELQRFTQRFGAPSGVPAPGQPR